jgi:heme-degrading monooxygenase HmoA
MFVAIRKYRLVAGAYEEIERAAEREFVPLLRRAEGFLDYYWVRTGPETYLTVSIFEERAQAEASSRLAADWLERHRFGAKYVGQPEVQLGELAFDTHSLSFHLPPGQAEPAPPAP